MNRREKKKYHPRGTRDIHLLCTWSSFVPQNYQATIVTDQNVVWMTWLLGYGFDWSWIHFEIFWDTEGKIKFICVSQLLEIKFRIKRNSIIWSNVKLIEKSKKPCKSYCNNIYRSKFTI